MIANSKTFVAVAARAAGRVFIDRNFALLWVGQGISLLGDFMFNTTLVLWVANGIARNQSWAPFAVSFALLAGSLPGLVIGPFVGVFVDRWNKRGALLWLNAIQALLMLALIVVAGIAPLLWAPHTPQGGIHEEIEELIALIVVVLGVSICNQFFLRAIIALLPDLVGQSRRAQAMGLMQALVSCGLLLGPAVGAALFFAVGAVWALLFDAVSFLVSWLTICAIHAPLSPRIGVDTSNLTSGAGPIANPRQQSLRPTRSYGGEFLDGLRFFCASRVLMTLLIAAILVAPTEGAISVLNIFSSPKTCMPRSPPTVSLVRRSAQELALERRLVARWRKSSG
jgi:MFS family permease